MLPSGRVFFKMSGSGNDFIVVDATGQSADDLLERDMVRALCARATGIGADGVVLLEHSSVADYRMTYLNSDGSRANLCGNASLCSARLASELGLLKTTEFKIQTDAGVLAARLSNEGAEIDLPAVRDVRPGLPIRLEPGERSIGFALAGVPHLVVRVDDVEIVDVVGRGRPLRHHASLEQGANVNFVSATGGVWRVRTYERGVEGETLACGTGAVATAILLAVGAEITDRVALMTRSGRLLQVRLSKAPGGGWQPSLSGEARIVFQGQIGEL